MTVKERYINPFTDFGFKKLFGTELNKELLIDFLNEVILPEQKKIADLKYGNAERMGQTAEDRKAVFDLYCVSATGERFIVEMQKAKQNYFKDRSVFYASFPIQEQAQTGDWDYQLSPIYTVGILDFVFGDDGTASSTATDAYEVRHEVKLKNQHGQVFYDKLTFIYLEMPNFIKKEEQLGNTYDKWLYVLKHLPRLTERPARLQERIFQKLFEAAEIAKFSPEEKSQYEDSLKSYRDLKNVVDTAFDDGKITEKTANILKALKRGKLSIEEITEDFSATLDFVLKIKEENGL